MIIEFWVRKADLCSRCQLGDWYANNAIHVLDAQASESLSHHTEAIVGAAVLLTAALATAAIAASICTIPAMCMLNHTVPHPPHSKTHIPPQLYPNT